jgi:riboflavin transporter FmnP
MAFNWKFLVPLSLANIAVVALADRLAQSRLLGLVAGTWPWALVMLAFNLALILPLVALQLGLLAAGLVDLLRRPRERVRGGVRWPWVLLIVLVGTIGPLTSVPSLNGPEV